MVKNKKLIITIIVLILVLFVSNIIYNNYNKSSVVDDKQFEIKNSVISQQPSLEPVKTLKTNLNNLLGSQVFSFTTSLTKDFKSVSYLRTSPKVYKHTANGIGGKIGGSCNVGEYIRVVECSTSSQTNVLNPSFQCPTDKFDNMWYISKNGDYLDLNNFYTKGQTFNYMYMCYKYDNSNLINEPSCISGNSCVTQKVAGAGATCYQFQQNCLNVLKSKSTPPVKQKLGGVTPTTPYGTFTNINFPNKQDQLKPITVSGTFVVTGNHPNLYLEAVINTKSFTPSFSVISSTSSTSACDSSGFWAGEMLTNVKDGDVINFNYKILTPQKVGNYNLKVYAVKGCWVDVGYDNNVVNANIQNPQITITKQVFQNTNNDWDKDGIINTQDNCKYNANKLQYDIDKDNVGDICDACPLTVGDVGNAGCPLKNSTVKIGGGFKTQKQTFDTYIKHQIAIAEKKRLQLQKEQQTIGGGGPLVDPIKLTPDPNTKCKKDDVVFKTCSDKSVIVEQVCSADGQMVVVKQCNGNSIIDNSGSSGGGNSLFGGNSNSGSSTNGNLWDTYKTQITTGGIILAIIGGIMFVL